MSTAVLVPLTMFLLNEATRELYVLPAEAAGKFEGAKPCVSIRNTFGSPNFSSQTLDQMCAYLAQQTLPRLTSSIKTTWSSDHGAKVGMTIRNLVERGNSREAAPVWPPDIPFSVAGLSQMAGVVVLFGVKAVEQKQATLERVDVWAQYNGQFKRTYWSRSINDPTRFLDSAKVIQRMGSQIRRTWASTAAPVDTVNKIKILVDKKISERELSMLESIVSSIAQVKSGIFLSPIGVQKDGIVFQTPVELDKAQELQGKLTRDFSGYKLETISDGSVDFSLKFIGGR
jgi:hypothetical protein